ncbi:hypothetical protein LASHA2_01050 [Lactiplantibacillus plantarum]
MAKTTKQLADEIGVSKSAVRKQLTEDFRAQYVHEVGNILQIDDEGVQIIRDHFGSDTAGDENDEVHTHTAHERARTPHSTRTNTGENAAWSDRNPADVELIQVLKDQLEQRNQEIERRSAEMAEMQRLMDQSQQLLLSTQTENARLLALQNSGSSSVGKAKEGEYSEVHTHTDKERVRTPDGTQSEMESDAEKDAPPEQGMARCATNHQKPPKKHWFWQKKN